MSIKIIKKRNTRTLLTGVDAYDKIISKAKFLVANGDTEAAEILKVLEAPKAKAKIIKELAFDTESKEFIYK